MNDYVWIVTYWEPGEEPVVAAFSNEEAAQSCYNYFVIEHTGACIDKVRVFSTVSFQENE